MGFSRPSADIDDNGHKTRPGANFKSSLAGQCEVIEAIVIHVLDSPTGHTNQMVVRFKISVIAGMCVVDGHDEANSLKGVERVVDGVR